VLVLVCSCAHEAQSFQAGDSMLPTFAVGATVTLSRLETAVRGHVVVFRAPEKPERQYVKRIIGLPGDTISVNATEIVVNGAPIPRCRVGAWTYTEVGGQVHAGDVWLEALAETRWLVFHDASGSASPVGPWTVAPGEVFVLGDNREHSHDSRMWYGGRGGGLPLRFIVGAADVTVPTLPSGAESLQSALDTCMATVSERHP
jgi:signal peptidase I